MRSQRQTSGDVYARLVEAAARHLGDEAAATVARLAEQAGPEAVIRAMAEVIRRREEVLA